MSTSHNVRMKNFLHGMASVSFVIWMIGFFGYQLYGWFYAFLAFSVIALFLLLPGKRKSGHDVKR